MAQAAAALSISTTANYRRTSKKKDARTVPELEDSISASSQSATLRDAIVGNQWNYIRALELLDEKRAGDLQQECDGLAARSEKTPILPLGGWPGLAKEHHQAYQRSDNQTRLRRLLDYVVADDRVLDIGCGFGYVSGVLLRDTQLSYYCGIDVGAHRIRAAGQMLAANGLDPKRCHFETRDLFQVDARFVQHLRPTLIIACEVLEHLHDPEQALDAIARVAPADAAILFSVPLAGRLEDVQGHVSFFNAERLIYLCQKTNLTVQYVEPIFNKWVYVLATPGDNVPERLVQLIRKTPPPAALAQKWPQPRFSERTGLPAQEAPAMPEINVPTGDVQPVPIRFSPRSCEHASHWNYRTRRVEIVPADGGLKCTVVGGPDDSAGQYGGVRFPTQRLKALRLDLSVLDPDNVLSVHVVGYGHSKRTAAVEWVWKRKRNQAISAARTQHLLVPGAASGRFVPDGCAGLDAIEETHVFIRIVPGSAAGFILHGAEVIK